MSISPGPWRWNELGELVAADGTVIVFGGVWGTANGALIEAAPELLQVLQDMLSDYHRVYSDRARALIARLGVG